MWGEKLSEEYSLLLVLLWLFLVELDVNIYSCAVMSEIRRAVVSEVCRRVGRSLV